jgi:predicted nucleic acid-binding protein
MALKNIYNFHRHLPAAIYWDASFVVNFASQNARYHEECKEFYYRLKKEKVPSFISTLTLDESWFILLQAKIEEDNSPKSFWQVYHRNPQTILNYLPQIEELQNKLMIQAHISLLGIHSSFSPSALTNMKSYSFLPRDAFHLAVMDSHNIRAIVTTDSHFQKVSHLKIYTCNPTMF